MTNEALQSLIGSWFPNPEADKVSEVIKKLKIRIATIRNSLPKEVGIHSYLNIKQLIIRNGLMD